MSLNLYEELERNNKAQHPPGETGVSELTLAEPRLCERLLIAGVCLVLLSPWKRPYAEHQACHAPLLWHRGALPEGWLSPRSSVDTLLGELP